MKRSPHLSSSRRSGPVVVIGAGIGGLAAALPLAHAGMDVTVLDRHSWTGGKMRQVPSAAGGVDAGPTVLTLRHVFDALFDSVGETLDTHVTLHKQDILARHWWPQSGPLDLFAETDRSADAIGAFAGLRAKRDFERFHARTKRLFDAFDAPMMRAADPAQIDLTATVAKSPSLLQAMAPMRTLAGLLRRTFQDPRLQQLFGRYATYVGGSPYATPALLSLVWQAEARGVWAIEGGMYRLAEAITDLFLTRGGQLRLDSHVNRILSDSDGVTGVALADGSVLPAKTVVFNGDPRAIGLGQLGENVQATAQRQAHADRSLSAHVWAFSARPEGPELVHHNVFFCADPKADFAALQAGILPEDTTLYLCAEDRGLPHAVPDPERFEIILNAPPLTRRSPDPKEVATCRRRTFDTLKHFGLSFLDPPDAAALTTPQKFEGLFPASAGSLYGRSPQGLTSSLSRPRARTTIPGLFLCGGGCHPGPGVPMAALSGRHAAAAILKDQTSTLPSRPTVTRGGMSMRSQIAERARSPSSGS